jgi:hypothetical protein
MNRSFGDIASPDEGHKNPCQPLATDQKPSSRPAERAFRAKGIHARQSAQYGRCDDRQAVSAPTVDTCRRAHLIRHMLINLMLIVVKTQCL